MEHGNVSPGIAKGLLALQRRIKAANVPSSKLDETVNVATWNIREFGKKPRTEAAVHYIAEILGQFDLIGVVELRDDLTDLGRVLKILGPYWRAVYSDAIPDPGGNRERIAFLYDKRAGREQRAAGFRLASLGKAWPRVPGFSPRSRFGLVLDLES